MDVGSELTTAVGVTEKVAYDSEDSTDGLEWYMPARMDDLRKGSTSALEHKIAKEN